MLDSFYSLEELVPRGQKQNVSLSWLNTTAKCKKAIFLTDVFPKPKEAA